MNFDRIAITGGTGSLGQALVAFLLCNTDATILVISRDEHKQFLMRQRFGEDRIRYLLGDVRDLSRMMLACRGVDLVFHCAALKYVDIGEYNPSEFIATNVGGTDNVAKACIERGVRKAIFISSDKAVHATNLYGSSKSTAAALWACANAYDPHGCVFTTVRWANVAGSRGSVIPLWRSQLARSLPPTLTSRQMSRFWITLDEAVACAWFAAQHGQRGYTYVPHLPAYHVVDLLQAVCIEAGVLEVAPHEIAVRPGEKLAELLATDEELDRAMTYHAPNTRYYSIAPVAPSWDSAPVCPHVGPDYAWEETGGVTRPYQSNTWPWRLGVEDLRTRLEALGI